jgi:hypothetical protein
MSLSPSSSNGELILDRDVSLIRSRKSNYSKVTYLHSLFNRCAEREGCGLEFNRVSSKYFSRYFVRFNSVRDLRRRLKIQLVTSVIDILFDFLIKSTEVRIVIWRGKEFKLIKSHLL